MKLAALLIAAGASASALGVALQKLRDGHEVSAWAISMGLFGFLLWAWGIARLLRVACILYLFFSIFSLLSVIVSILASPPVPHPIGRGALDYLGLAFRFVAFLLILYSMATRRVFGLPADRGAVGTTVPR